MITISTVLLVRSLGALGVVTLLYTAGRLGGVALIGAVATLQVITLGAAIFSCLGAGQYLNKIASYDGDHRYRTLVTALLFTIALSLSLTIILALCLKIPAILRLFDITPELGLWFVLAIPALTAGYVLSGFFKGLGMPAIGVGLESGLPALLGSVAVLVMLNQYTAEGGIALGVAYCVSAWSVVGVGLVYLITNSSGADWTFSVADVWNELGGIYARVKAFHLIMIGNFLHANAFVLIVSMQLGADDAGLVRVVERLAMLISFPLAVVNAMCARAFAQSYNSGDLHRLNREYRKSVLTSFCLGLPIFLVIVGFSEILLPYFGIDPVQGRPLLLLLSVGHLVNIVTGSIAVLLNMTGYERVVRNVTLLNSAISLPALWVMSAMSAYNVAFTLAVFLVAQNVLLVFYAFRYVVGRRKVR